MKTQKIFFPTCLTLALFSLTSVARAELDCAEIINALKLKHSWFHSGDFKSNFEELIKTSSFSQYSSSSASGLNVAAVIQGVPVTFGGSMKEDQYNYVQNKLTHGVHLQISDQTVERFTEETLADGSMEAILACIGHQQGFAARLVHRKSQELVSLAMVYHKINANDPDSIILSQDYTLLGLDFVSPMHKQQFEQGKFELKHNESRVVSFKRKPTPNSPGLFDLALLTIQPKGVGGSGFDKELPATQPLKNPTINWLDETSSEQTVVGGGGVGNGAWFGLHVGQFVEGEYHFALGADTWPRNIGNSDVLRTNLTATACGIFNPNNGQVLFDPNSFGQVAFTSVSWNEDTHEISFHWRTPFGNNGPMKVMDVHANVRAKMLTKRRVIN